MWERVVKSAAWEEKKVGEGRGEGVSEKYNMIIHATTDSNSNKNKTKTTRRRHCRRLSR